MKEGVAGDNLAVGWLKPGQSGTAPSEVIPGSVLAPFTTGDGGTGGASGTGGAGGTGGSGATGGSGPTGGTSGTGGSGGSGGFDARAFLSNYTPGTAGEDFPHGVPSGYSWYGKAVGGTPSRPSAATTHMNLWGQIYVNLSNYRAPNTRVTVKNSKLLVLYPGSSTWTILQQTDNLGGGAWTEDFRGNCPTFDIRIESDASRSMIPLNGCNAHFWPNLPFSAVPTVPRAVLSIAHTRLVLADASRADDRASSAYIISVGADWRAPDGSCPGGVCTGVGLGKFIKPTSEWRAAVMSTMSSAELASLPMPAQSIFQLPDGKYPTR